jgi:hypothetical protein
MRECSHSQGRGAKRISALPLPGGRPPRGGREMSDSAPRRPTNMRAALAQQPFHSPNPDRACHGPRMIAGLPWLGWRLRTALPFWGFSPRISVMQGQMLVLSLLTLVACGSREPTPAMSTAAPSQNAARQVPPTPLELVAIAPTQFVMGPVQQMPNPGPGGAPVATMPLISEEEMRDHGLARTACKPGSPTITAKVVSALRSKPPVMTYFVNIKIDNPLSRKIWLVYNVGGEFPSNVSSVTLSRADFGIPASKLVGDGEHQDIEELPQSLGRGGYLWSIYGGTGWANAVLLAPGASIVLLHLPLDSEWDSKTEDLYFVDEIMIGTETAPAWFGKPGVAPSRGAFFAKDTWSGTNRDADEKLPITIKVLCMQSVAVALDEAAP